MLWHRGNIGQDTFLFATRQYKAQAQRHFLPWSVCLHSQVGWTLGLLLHCAWRRFYQADQVHQPTDAQQGTQSWGVQEWRRREDWYQVHQGDHHDWCLETNQLPLWVKVATINGYIRALYTMWGKRTISHSNRKGIERNITETLCGSETLKRLKFLLSAFLRLSCKTCNSSLRT